MNTLTFVTFGTFCHRAPPDHCLVALWCSRQRRLHRQPCRFPHCVQVGVQVSRWSRSRWVSILLWLFQRMEQPINSVKALAENKQGIEYGWQRYGSTDSFFQISQSWKFQASADVKKSWIDTKVSFFFRRALWNRSNRWMSTWERILKGWALQTTKKGSKEFAKTSSIHSLHPQIGSWSVQPSLVKYVLQFCLHPWIPEGRVWGESGLQPGHHRRTFQDGVLCICISEQARVNMLFNVNIWRLSPGMMAPMEI